MLKRIGKYFVNVLLSIDQLGNTILCGDPDETISSRIGKIKRHHGGKIPWRHWPAKIVDWGLERIDKDHSIEAIEDDEGGDAVLRHVRKETNNG